MICFCKNEIPADGRKVHVTTAVDWGLDDLRDSSVKADVVCSFKCAAELMLARAANHDGPALVEGTDEAFGNEPPVEPVAAVVDTVTEGAVR